MRIKNMQKNINRIVAMTLVLGLMLAIPILAYADNSYEDAGEFIFELFDRDSGLSNLSISSIIQDKDGFLWIGTQGGLNRYDGINIKVYRSNPFDSNGLVHNLIQTMYYDEDNHEIWIGTYQGLSRFNIETSVFENYSVEDDGLSNPVIVAINKDDKGNIWAGTLDGLNKIDPTTKEVVPYTLPSNVVRSLLIDHTGRLLIGSYEGLHYYDIKTDSIESFDITLPSPTVMTLNEFVDGVITLGLWGGGISKFNLETNTIETEQYDDDRIYSYMQSEDGTKYIGTWGGGLFAHKKNGEIIHYSGDLVEKTLNHPVVYSMLEDSTGNLWFGTNGGGLFKVNPMKRNFVKLSYNPEISNSLPQGKINKIISDDDENLWIAVYNNGLCQYNSKTDIITHYLNDSDDLKTISSNQIIDLFEIEQDKLLIGSTNGLDIYDMKTEIFSSMSILPESTTVYAIEKVSDTEIWIGTYKNGIYSYNLESKSIKQYKSGDNKSISNNLIYDILYDSKGRVWVATNNGLNLYDSDEDNFNVYKKVSSDYNQLPSNSIRLVFETSKGEICIGTSGGGLAIYNESSDDFYSFTEKEGMSSNTISGILEGSDGRLWVATENGISIVNLVSNDIFVLTPDEGIGGWEFNSGHYKDSDGNLFFGGIHGITKISENHIQNEIEIPRVYITNINIFQKPIDDNKNHFNGETIELNASDTSLSFDFISLDYNSPDKTSFSYKLKGFDNDWINTGSRKYASYSHLPPGNYEFIVKSRNISYDESEPVSVYFTIAKPWYSTNLAYIIYIVILAFLVYLIYKTLQIRLTNKRNVKLAAINSELESSNRNLVIEADKRIKAEQAKQEIEEFLRKQQKLESIGVLAGGVAHEINNPINGIMNYGQMILDSKMENEDNYEYAKEIILESERVSTIVRNLLQFSRQESGQFSKISIKDIINKSLSLFKTLIKSDQIILEVNIKDSLPEIPCKNQEMQQVILNLMTNARDSLNLKYPEYDSNKKIIISAKMMIDNNEKFIRITVEDHGNGIHKDLQSKIFDPFFTTKSRTEGTGLGLSISYRIINEHNGELSFESEEGNYTRFYIDLPLVQSINSSEGMQ